MRLALALAIALGLASLKLPPCLAQNAQPVPEPPVKDKQIEALPVSPDAPANEAPADVRPPFPDQPAASEHREELPVLPAQFPAESVPETFSLPETGPTREPASDPTHETPPALAPGRVRILSPTRRSTRRRVNLVVQSRADESIAVRVNGQPLAADLATTREVDEQGLATQVWYGLPLAAGENVIAVSAGSGPPVTLTLNVTERAPQIAITPVGDPQLPADGRSTAEFTGTIQAGDGEVWTDEAIVTLTASAGEWAGADDDEDRPGFQVLARNGQFRAQLRSDLTAQKVTVRAALDPDDLPAPATPPDANEAIPAAIATATGPETPLEARTQIQFVPHLRPSLLAGVLRFRVGEPALDYWGSFRDFLDPAQLDDGVQVDFSSAVFATGSFGEWRFTGAYNSDRPLNETCDGITRLFRGPQFCEQQYPTYGDNSTTEYLTPSLDSVYARFERASPVPDAEADYIMWGDYTTSELARRSQLFTGINRQLNGFKGNYSLGPLQLTALYSDKIEGFQRDTIAPDGTSGYYFLSRRLVRGGSERVFVEVERLNEPGVVVERRSLQRGADYEIDYDRGTILLRQPLRQVEFDLFGESLAQRLVATYQFEGADSGDTALYGARLQYNLERGFGRESWAAATYLSEDQGARQFELYGGDALLPLGDRGQVQAEFARSDLDGTSGEAYRLEATANLTAAIAAQAYYRSVDDGFVNEATESFRPGQRRYGAAIGAAVGPTTRLSASYSHEANFGLSPSQRFTAFDPFNLETFSLFDPDPVALSDTRVDNELTTIRAGVQQELGDAALRVDYVNRSRQDRAGETFDSNASQLVANLLLPLTDDLQFRAQNELNLGSSDPLYPTRTTLGLDWALQPGVTLRLAHQFFDGGLLGDNTITSVETLSTAKLGENTTLTTRQSIVGGNNSLNSQGTLGLTHRLTLAPGLNVDFGYERVTSRVDSLTAAGDRFLQPFARGQTGSSLAIADNEAYNVSFNYNINPNFRLAGRFEQRHGSTGSNTVLGISAAGRPTPEITTVVNYERASAANLLLEDLDDTENLKFGIAYRNPLHDHFNLLFSYEYRRNPSTIPETLLVGSGTGSRDHVLALEAILSPNWRWEFYAKYALRHTSTELANNFTADNLIDLGQFRITYRLGFQWDVAIEGRAIRQLAVGYQELGGAIELGYYVTSDLRLGLGYSAGSVSDRDFGGFRSDGGLYFNVTYKLNEFFGGFGRQNLIPPLPASAPNPEPATAAPTEEVGHAAP